MSSELVMREKTTNSRLARNNGSTKWMLAVLCVKRRKQAGFASVCRSNRRQR